MKRSLLLLPLLIFSFNQATAKYVETEEDSECYDQAQGSMVDIALCFESSGNKVYNNIEKRIKQLNKQKNYTYTIKWLEQSHDKLKEQCRKKYYKDGDYISYAQMEECVRDGLSTLEEKFFTKKINTH
ncbi:MAG: hypothetical protein GKC53_04325 [Neisseriaceae bacterium]|nr:MAG: hypothetical protein GKC53_04325 [Neisseriaceae bacterium]